MARDIWRRVGIVCLSIFAFILLGIIWATPAAAAASEKIFFTTYNTNRIATINPDGTGYKELRSGSLPQPSPDGTRIAFVLLVNVQTQNVDIYVSNSDGSNAVDITTDNPGEDGQPTWSADGRRIAFVSTRNNVSGIYIMDSDGTGATLVFANPGAAEPTFSPDGRHIAFRYNADTGSEIGVINTDATGFVKLTTNGGNISPAWSPDGTRIAWAASCANCGGRTISTMHPDGTGRIDLVQEPVGGDVATPTWSPDSSTVAYATYRGPGGGAPFNYRLWAINSGGGNERQIFASELTGVINPFWGRSASFDIIPPVLSLPGNLSVDASSPAGAIVSYSASAKDDDGTTPVVSCAPSSGSTFPIGVTTVRCTATDTAGNVATGTFTVTVKGASAQLTDLRARVAQIGAGKILTATIAVAQNELKSHHTAAACRALLAFTREVHAQSGRSINPAVAQELIADAVRIRLVIPC